jgi:uncharacterized protein
MSFRFIDHYIFEKIILKSPRTVLVFILIGVIVLAYGTKHFRLDATAETLVIENDKDLRYTRLIEARYKETNFLMLTFKPKEDLFSEKSLATLAQIRNEVRQVNSVESVMTILDVPLLQSPPVPLNEMASTTRTLESPDVDRALARKELAESPLYQNLMVSPDFKTTAIILSFASNPEYDMVFNRRNELLEKKESVRLTEQEEQELKIAKKQCVVFHDQSRQIHHRSLAAIRAIMDKYRGENGLFLGGVSMISDDMVNFIRSDLRVFGTAVFMLLVIVIATIFRRFYWVLLPMLICIISVTCTIGLLGWAGWEVTVISSNFISLQLIITLAMTIHLMVRYRELAINLPDASQSELILATISDMLRPCIYAGLTTMAGFASLIFCNIKPIISFGYIMVVGVAISIIVPFLLLPAILVLTPREKPRPVIRKSRWNLTLNLGRFTEAFGPWIVIASIILLVVNALGIRRLQVENCFINYFKSATEIHQGMKVVDQQLGGTTPLNVIIDLGQSQQPEIKPADETADSEDIIEQFETQSQENKNKYWFTPEKMARIAAVHDYLESLPETGKVLSVVTLVRMIERANGDKPLDSLELALLFNKIPEQLKQILVNPYVSVEHNEFRINIRILDSMPSLNRNILLKKIHTDIMDKFAFKPEQVHLTGMLVLYNNMLQNLYTSQIVTMGFATLSLLGAFIVLFRSIRIAAIAIFPNILAVSCVLGAMGWLNIPLDMMTITIAAIGVGLADDDTIHYIHRFKHEFETTGSYIEALRRSHDSIGHAIYYTTVTLVIGFSILCLSNFIPTIYFGLFTVLAITVALLASLTLLPELLVTLKPYGRKPKSQKKQESVSR